MNRTQKDIELRMLKLDIAIARKIIQQGLDQYIKRQVGARNKKQAADLETLFAELNPYRCREDITEDYAWAVISDDERARLLTMWDAREIARENSGKYVDRITEMLELEIRRVGSEYDQIIYGAEDEHGQEVC